MKSSPLVALAPLVFAVAAFAQPVHWEHAGWGGGGYCWACAFHPTNPRVLYLGGDVAGIYKTEDQGRHWRFANAGLHNYGVYGLAGSAAAPETVYAQTLDGLARSTDGGAHWEALPDTRRGALDLSAVRGVSVRPVAIDPTDADIVYAGGGCGRLGKSEDGGRTWRRLPYLETALPPSVAAATPAFTGKGFLVLAFESDRGEWSRNGRVQKSLAYPQGADWSGYRKLTARFCAPPGAPKLEGQLVVQTGDNWLWQQGPFTAGQPGTWTEVSLDLAGLKSLDKARQAYFVVRSPERGYKGEVFLDTVALHREGGTSVQSGTGALPAGVTLLGDWEKPGDAEGWQPSRKVTDATFVTAARNSSVGAQEQGSIASVTVAPSDPRVVFACSTAYGLLRSRDAGATWARLPGLHGAQCVTVAPADARLLYAACGEGGVWRSSDQGASWTTLNEGLAPGAVLREVALNPRRPGTLYAIAALNWDGICYRSEDGGARWTAATAMGRDLSDNPTLPEETGGRLPRRQAALSRPTNLAVCPANPDLLFVSANWRNAFSSDGGRTWEERSRGADITCTQDLQFAGDRTYAVAMDEGLLVSEDEGRGWRQLAPLRYSPEVSGHQWRVRVLPRAAGERLISTVSPWSGGPNAVLFSDDGGRSFTKTGAGLPTYVPKANTMWGQGYARALAVDPHAPEVLYLAIDGDPEPAQGLSGGGLFRSTDGGSTWQPLPAQPGSRRGFFGLAVDPTDSRRLYFGACGEGGGVWRSQDAGATWERVFGGEGWVFNLAVSAAGEVYAGGANLWRSADHGQTWKPLTRFASGGAVIVGLELHPTDGRRLWVSRVTWGEGAEGGIYRTSDGGTTWEDITGDIGYRKPLVLRYNPATRQLWAGGVGIFRTGQ